MLRRTQGLSSADALKFGLAVAFGGIFLDAAIAHGLFWENDPYWTYWITKTFLIATVFTLGTALFGVGVAQGLILTAVHTLILEIYYQFFAPIGLPQEPQWLSEKDLWFPWGFPSHYLVIGAAYFLALWLWRRRGRLAAVDSAMTAVTGLLGALLVVVLDAIVTQGILLGRFAGVTFYVQHLLIAVVFLYFWTAFVGWDVRGWLAAAALLALVWTTYSMYLGPVDLPFTAQPHYLGYEDLWLRSWPGATLSGLVAFYVLRIVAPRVRGVMREVLV